MLPNETSAAVIDLSTVAENQAQELHNEQEAKSETERTGEKIEAEPLWYYDDGKPGEGDRPEFLKAKYKTVKEQAKAYPELEKKFGGFTGAPEEYTFQGLEEAGFKVDPTNPILQAFTKTAKEANMSQEFFNKALVAYGESLKGLQPPTKEQLMQGLGPDAEQTVSLVGRWVNNVLSADEVKVLNTMLRTPEQIKVLNKLRANQMSTAADKLPSPQQATQYSLERTRTKDEIQQEMSTNFEKYNKDPTYRAKLVSELAKILG